MAVIWNLRLQWEIKFANMNHTNVLQSRIVQLCTKKYYKVVQAYVSQNSRVLDWQRVCTYDIIIKIKIQWMSMYKLCWATFLIVLRIFAKLFQEKE